MCKYIIVLRDVLRTAYLIVKSMASKRRIHKAENFVYQALSVEPGSLDGADRPARVHSSVAFIKA